MKQTNSTLLFLSLTSTSCYFYRTLAGDGAAMAGGTEQFYAYQCSAREWAVSAQAPTSPSTCSVHVLGAGVAGVQRQLRRRHADGHAVVEHGHGRALPAGGHGAAVQPGRVPCADTRAHHHHYNNNYHNHDDDARAALRLDGARGERRGERVRGARRRRHGQLRRRVPGEHGVRRLPVERRGHALLRVRAGADQRLPDGPHPRLHLLPEHVQGCVSAQRYSLTCIFSQPALPPVLVAASDVGSGRRESTGDDPVPRHVRRPAGRDGRE